MARMHARQLDRHFTEMEEEKLYQREQQMLNEQSEDILLFDPVEEEEWQHQFDDRFDQWDGQDD